MKRVRVLSVLVALVATIVVGAANAAFQLAIVNVPMSVVDHIKLALDAAEKWEEKATDESLAIEIQNECAAAIDMIDPDPWVLKCTDADDEGKRCGNRMGMMGVCEGYTCRIPTCTLDYDCVMVASLFGFKDSCRGYSCLHGQCVDQFNVNATYFDAQPGVLCQSSTIMQDGICDERGDCRVFECAIDADCPGYGLECGRIGCDQSTGTCLPSPHPDGTPCTDGVCINGLCQ